MAAQRKRKKCRVCPNKEQTRELCSDHREDARQVIAAGVATEADLIAAGLMAPKKPMGRPSSKRKKKSPPVSLDGNLILKLLQERMSTVSA